MANDVTGFQVIAYDRRVQQLLEKQLVAKAITSFAMKGGMVKGDTVKRPRHEDLVVADYTKYTDVTMQDIDTSQETLTIDQSKIVPFALDRVDEVQSDFQVAMKYAQRSAFRLANEMDGKLMEEVLNAQYDIDDGDIGGTSGNPIVLTASNVINTVSTTFAELRANDVSEGLFLVLDPYAASIVEQAAIANGFNIADATFKNGYAGDFLGGRIFVSNNVHHTVSLGIATNVTADDTIVINGVTLTAKAVPSAAGEFDIGANAAATVDNIVALINGTGTPSATTYIDLSAANRRKLSNARVVATDNTTAIGITSSGRMALSETLTDASDGFGVQTGHMLAGVSGSIDMVMQDEINTLITQEPKQLVKNYLTHALYGIKTYTEGAEKLCELNLQAQATTI